MEKINIFATGQYPDDCTDTESLDRLVTGYLTGLLETHNEVCLTTGIDTNFELLCAMSAMRLGGGNEELSFNIIVSREEYEINYAHIDPALLSPQLNIPERYLALLEASDIIHTENRVHDYLEAVRQSDILLYFPDIGDRPDYFLRYLITEAKTTGITEVVNILDT